MTIPVYICTGFLNSGKSTFIKETLLRQDWIEDGTTFFIRCEEGEVEFDADFLEENEMYLLDIDDMNDMNKVFLKYCENMYHPAQVIVEYNGMWDLQEIMNADFPENWEIQGVYSTVNGETLEMYLKNMRNILLNQLVESELIIVNRCGENVNRAGFRRSMKVQNPEGQILFEDPEGNIIPPTEEDLPYDVKAQHIDIADEDFGIWYVDAYENPERYVGKELSFLAQLFRPKNMPNNMVIPGRMIMACCAEDVEFYGYPTFLPGEAKIEQRQWVRVTVRFEFKKIQKFNPKQPCLYLLGLKKAEKPEDEIVYLG